MRRRSAWWNLTDDPYWDVYYAILWMVVAMFMMLIGAALLNPRSWEDAPRKDCRCEAEPD